MPPKAVVSMSAQLVTVSSVQRDDFHDPKLRSPPAWLLRSVPDVTNVIAEFDEWNPTSKIASQASYQCWRPGSQITLKVNTALVPSNPNFGSAVGPNEPSHQTKRDEFLAQGLTLGVEPRY